MICPKCNNSIPDDCKFCPDCGYKFPQLVTCTSCGYNKISEGSKFCPSCGSPLNREEEKMQAPTGPCSNYILINGHRAIDLGLSVLWADSNLGTNSEIDEGLEYTWGDPSRKTITSTISNWFTGAPRSNNICGGKYDMARYSNGSSWQLPTARHFQELLELCDWYNFVYKGRNAYLVVGPNKNYIILPANIDYWVGDNANGNNVCHLKIREEFYCIGFSSQMWDVDKHKYVRPIATR